MGQRSNCYVWVKYHILFHLKVTGNDISCIHWELTPFYLSLSLSLSLSHLQTAELAVSVDRVRPPTMDSQEWAETADSTVQASESQRTTGNQGNGLASFCGIKMELYLLPFHSFYCISHWSNCTLIGDMWCTCSESPKKQVKKQAHAPTMKVVVPW